jgi:phytoene dehydrogenase-like protein
MISIPSVWDANLAPQGHHVVHAYTLEPYDGWRRDEGYNQKKKERSQPLLRALERVIPDIRERIDLELIGTPSGGDNRLKRLVELAFHPVESSKNISLLTGLLQMSFEPPCSR